jgi:hypothetical protein
MTMAMDVRPDRRVTIEIASTLRIPQPRTFTAHDRQGLVIRRAPIGLPRERMPAVRAIGLNPAAGVITHRAECEPITRSGKAESGGGTLDFLTSR